MRGAIGRSDSGRLRNRECAGGRNFISNNSMHCEGCAGTRGGSYSRRARNTRPGNGSVGFPRLARSVRRCCWASCRHRIVFAVQIFLTADATYLMRKATSDAVLPIGWPPLSELREKIVAKHIPVFS